jgi:hypothetical protein
VLGNHFIAVNVIQGSIVSLAAVTTGLVPTKPPQERAGFLVYRDIFKRMPVLGQLEAKSEGRVAVCFIAAKDWDGQSVLVWPDIKLVRTNAPAAIFSFSQMGKRQSTQTAFCKGRWRIVSILSTTPAPSETE